MTKRERMTSARIHIVIYGKKTIFPLNFLIHCLGTAKDGDGYSPGCSNSNSSRSNSSSDRGSAALVGGGSGSIHGRAGCLRATSVGDGSGSGTGSGHVTSSSGRGTSSSAMSYLKMLHEMKVIDVLNFARIKNSA